MTENLRLKFLALVFSAALWFFVAGQSATEIGLSVPAGFKGAADDLVVVSNSHSEIEVRVTGPKLFINNLSPSQVTAEVDLSGVREGLNTIRLSTKDVTAPTGVEVVRVRPSSMDVRLERVVSVDLPVRPRLSGVPAKGYRVSKTSISPKTARVSGIKRDFNGVEAVYTQPIDVAGLDRNNTVYARIEPPSGGLKLEANDSFEVRITLARER